MNVVCGPQDEGFPTVLMSAATGCKLAKLGRNKIEHQNTFFQYFFHFYPISGIHWTLKMPYVFEHLEVYMKTWFLCCFIKKWFHTILYHFNKSPLNTIMMNYWNGSYCVLTAWGLQTSRLDCLPWSAGQKYLKSLAHGRWGCNLKLVISKFISRIDILSISCDTLLS